MNQANGIAAALPRRRADARDHRRDRGGERNGGGEAEGGVDRRLHAVDLHHRAVDRADGAAHLDIGQVGADRGVVERRGDGDGRRAGELLHVDGAGGGQSARLGGGGGGGGGGAARHEPDRRDGKRGGGGAEAAGGGGGAP